MDYLGRFSQTESQVTLLGSTRCDLKGKKKNHFPDNLAFAVENSEAR